MDLVRKILLKIEDEYNNLNAYVDSDVFVGVFDSLFNAKTFNEIKDKVI